MLAAAMHLRCDALVTGDRYALRSGLRQDIRRCRDPLAAIAGRSAFQLITNTTETRRHSDFSNKRASWGPLLRLLIVIGQVRRLRGSLQIPIGRRGNRANALLDKSCLSGAYEAYLSASLATNLFIAERRTTRRRLRRLRQTIRVQAGRSSAARHDAMRATPLVLRRRGAPDLWSSGALVLVQQWLGKSQSLRAHVWGTSTLDPLIKVHAAV